MSLVVADGTTTGVQGIGKSLGRPPSLFLHIVKLRNNLLATE